MSSPGVLSSFEFNATYVHSLRQRDPATEEHFVSHFSPILLRKLRKHLRSTELAYDLRQETFLRVLKVLRSNQSIREPEHFEYFVLGVCNNVLHETYRQQKKEVSLDPEFEMLSNRPGPDTCVLTAEIEDHMHRMLSGLPPRARAILKAAFLEEQDRENICLKFGVNRNHLRLLICRAKKTLSECAQKQMSGKSSLQLRRSSGLKRKPIAPRIYSRRSVPESAIPRPAMILVPPVYATMSRPVSELVGTSV